MQILHRTDATRRVCAGSDALRRAFGAAWEMVALALTVLFNAANLAEVARMASVQMRRIAGVTGEAVQVVVRHGCAEVAFEGIHAGSADVDGDEQSMFQRIQVIVIDSISVTAAVPA